MEYYENYIEIIEENFDKIVEAMIALDKKYNRFQVDLYLYPDGETYEFTNVGGNSWLDDEHIVLWSVNHEFDEEITDEEYEEYEADVREYMKDALNRRVEELKDWSEQMKEMSEF